MKTIEYYQIYYISNVTKRKHNINICFVDKKEAERFLVVLKNYDSTIKYGYTKIEKVLYDSVEDYAKNTSKQEELIKY